MFWAAIFRLSWLELLNSLMVQHPRTGFESLEGAKRKVATLNDIAEYYRQMGYYDNALTLYHRAHDIREKVLGP